jgi:hypothetical protein
MKGLMFAVIFMCVFCKSNAQLVVYNLDFSSKKDTTLLISNVSRNGNVCTGSNCIQFNITLNPGSDLVSLDIKSPAPTGASAFYQVNCGPQTSLATPVCIYGMNTVTITYCKNGNDKPDYYISASSLVAASADLNLRQGCSGTMSVTGLQAGTINWTSITGTPGAYNSYLSCTSGCASTTVTPGVGAPAFIDYRVSGNSNLCTGARSDTIRVYTTPALTVAISPSNPAICSGVSATMTATPSGGNTPYTYSWSSGETTAVITKNVPATYTVTVSDNTNGCPAVVVPVNLAAIPTPAAPTSAGATICSGNTATMTASSSSGGTYHWYNASSGGTLLFTGASYTTPVLTTTTTYYAETTVNGCNSARTAVTATVNAIPVAPTASGTTICSGNTTSFTATAPGATYQWYDAASNGTLLSTGAPYTTPVLNTTTTYYVQSTSNGCSGPRTPVTATVNQTPTAPTAANATICSGNTASLTASAPGGTYRWYDAASNGNLLATNPTYTTPVLNSNATYYVQSTINSCTGVRTAVNVTVNATPVAPTAAGAGICAGNTASLSATAPGGTYRW